GAIPPRPMCSFQRSGRQMNTEATRINIFISTMDQLIVWWERRRSLCQIQRELSPCCCSEKLL
uniref:Uncharacterized protein n=1 Tax=Scophthalmus maximus TaxID=52904 RepID=A0A8D2ZWV8_SCOMX